MKFNKFKKLIYNPSGFVKDSKYLRYLNIKKNKCTLGFIIIGSDQELIRATELSIHSQKKENRPPPLPYKIINTGEGGNLQNHDLTKIVKELGVDFVKILKEGETLHRNFVKMFSLDSRVTINTDILITSLSNDAENCINDAVLNRQNIKSDAGQFLANASLIPLFSAVIFNRKTFSGKTLVFSQPGIASEIFLCLNLLGDSGRTLNYVKLENLYTIGKKIDNEIVDLIRDEENFRELFANAESYLKESTPSLLVKNSLLLLIHYVVLNLLINKKSDELISNKGKDEIIFHLKSIVSYLGKDVIKGFSSSNFNHIHKIGYLKLIDENAAFNITYVEDYDAGQKALKFKMAAHSDALPIITISKSNVIPAALKVKQLTLFDYHFAFEIYFWLPFTRVNEELVIASDMKTDFLVNGKRTGKIKISQAITTYNNKLKVMTNLPLKVKVLRYLAKTDYIKRKYKNVWLFIDNELRADDNAEHFYRYVSSKNVNSYFLLDKRSPDWLRLKNAGFNLIKFGGLMHRLALINAKMLLSSHANPAIVNFLPKKHFSDIMKYKFVFLQHGITKDDQSEWLNSRKIDYLVTAAWHEFNDIAGRGRYRYTANEIVLTGFPRYDNLYRIAQDKKQILIMPTWRKGLAGELMSKSSKRIKNPDFSESLFCKMWGGLLRSEKLKTLSNEHDYEIIFYPHPNLLDYMDELEIPEYIHVGDLQKGSIQEVFKSANILVTDFSSVAFDIAYMQKPVLYFQFDTDTFFSEHSYSKGYYDYHTLGFGPVTDSIGSLNNELEKLVENDCIVGEKFAQRISQFFPFSDLNNSERLFNTLNSAKNRDIDTATLLDYISMFVNEINIDKVEKLVIKHRAILEKASVWYQDKIAILLDEVAFFARIYNKMVLLETVASIADKLSLRLSCLNYDNFVINDTNNLSIILHYICSEFDAMDSLPLPECVFTYSESMSATERYAVTLLIIMVNHRHGFWMDNIQISKDEPLIFKNKALKSLHIILIVAMIKTGDWNTALKQAQTLKLKDTDVDIILTALGSSVDEDSSEKFDLTKLVPSPACSREAVISYFRLSKATPFAHYKAFIDANYISPEILTEYIFRLFRSKKHAEIVTNLKIDSHYEMFVTNAAHKRIYLFSLYHCEGIESFCTILSDATNTHNLFDDINALILTTPKDTDLDLLFSILESIIIKDIHPVSSQRIYKYVMLFYKNNRPGLAKKLISISLLQQHEGYYDNCSEWAGDNDFKTLIKAVLELNDSLEELNRISI